MKPLPRLLALVVLAWPATGAAQTYGTTTGHVEFTSSVPLHTFTGASDRLVGEIDLEAGTVDFYVDVGTIRTGIGKRDRDMRDALGADEHPFAEFYGRLLTPFDASATGPQRARVRGRFTVHGVARDVELEGTLERAGEGVRVRAGWIVRLSEHAIEPPRLLMVRVSDEQEVAIDALLEPKPDGP